MSLLRKLFGDGEPSKPEIQSPPPERLTLSRVVDRFVRIEELDFFGLSAASPNGRFCIVWRDSGDDGTRGGHREDGRGLAMLLDDECLVAAVRAERPNDCRVADNGTFIINDWLFGEGLKGRFAAHAADGCLLISHDLEANLINNALSADGRYGVCQTAHSPSDDSSKVFLFDLLEGKLLASWPPESGTADELEIDAAGRRVLLRRRDGGSATYDFAGRMIDREAWLAERIAAGDLFVIERVVREKGSTLNGVDAEPLLEGLAAAIARGEVFGAARAHRFKGEILEHLGSAEKALASYEEALLLDPQVGVRRRADKLRKLAGVAESAPAAGRFARQCVALRIEHDLLSLECGQPKQWRPRGDALDYCAVEPAALRHYEREGWQGCASEGGLILTLLKAASFPELSPRNADTFIEALYAQNVAFEEDRFEAEGLIATVETASQDQIRRNWSVIAASAGETPAFYPSVRWQHVEGLFCALGTPRLAEIARIFATAPYGLRAGWPDLTLWRDGEVRFVEVKAPGDQLHASQTRLIRTVLVPLQFRTGLAEVVVAG